LQVLVRVSGLQLVAQLVGAVLRRGLQLVPQLVRGLQAELVLLQVHQPHHRRNPEEVLDVQVQLLELDQMRW
jgi:hypothetical protein